jgi:hypothetical protein
MPNRKAEIRMEKQWVRKDKGKERNKEEVEEKNSGERRWTAPIKMKLTEEE